LNKIIFIFALSIIAILVSSCGRDPIVEYVDEGRIKSCSQVEDLIGKSESFYENAPQIMRAHFQQTLTYDCVNEVAYLFELGLNPADMQGSMSLLDSALQINPDDPPKDTIDYLKSKGIKSPYSDKRLAEKKRRETEKARVEAERKEKQDARTAAQAKKEKERRIKAEQNKMGYVEKALADADSINKRQEPLYSGDPKVTPLMKAVFMYDLDAIMKLIESGANPNSLDKVRVKSGTIIETEPASFMIELIAANYREGEKNMKRWGSVFPIYQRSKNEYIWLLEYFLSNGATLPSITKKNWRVERTNYSSLQALLLKSKYVTDIDRKHIATKLVDLSKNFNILESALNQSGVLSYVDALKSEEKALASAIKTLETIRSGSEETNAESLYNASMHLKRGAIKSLYNDEWIELLIQSALNGYAPAQSEYGRMLALGDGVPQNYKESFEWLTKSASQGDVDGEIYLGNNYEKGFGVAKDVKKAEEMYLIAAKKGDHRAQYSLGRLYYKESNYLKALPWLKKASEAGYAEATNILGVMYQHGYGVKKNYDIAMSLFEQAAANGSKAAKINIKDIKSYTSGNRMECIAIEDKTRGMSQWEASRIKSAWGCQ